MVKKLERFGRKNGKGFYEYPADGKKRLWPELQKYFPADRSTVITLMPAATQQ